MEGLLDNGCLAGDFVAKRIVDKYNIKPNLQSTAKLSVCSGLDNTCYDMSKSVIVGVNFFNERVKKIDNFEIKAIILDSSPLDLIIGRSILSKSMGSSVRFRVNSKTSMRCLYQRITPLSTRLSVVAVSLRRTCYPLEASQKVNL